MDLEHVSNVILVVTVVLEQLIVNVLLALVVLNGLPHLEEHAQTVIVVV